MTSEERDRRRAVVQPIVGVLAVLLLGALVIMMAKVLVERRTAEQGFDNLAGSVQAACRAGGQAAEELRRIGACRQAENIEQVVGPRGDIGVTGPEGPEGPAGPRGPEGPAGPAGPAGTKGDPGAAGAPGLLGQTGDTGPIGPQGPQGDTGAEGPQGPTGTEGPAGPMGPQGPPGPTCPEGYLPEERTMPTADPMVTETWQVCVKQPEEGE